MTDDDFTRDPEPRCMAFVLVYMATVAVLSAIVAIVVLL